ncbi:MAG: hypothetical protein JXA89_02815 [Anaerolineae bacterium]|nr:hypothetical protein [Anaerolineae bacterium]
MMLCRMGGDRCQVEANLATTTQGDGVSAFPNLGAGKYVILYNPNGGDGSDHDPAWIGLDV